MTENNVQKYNENLKVATFHLDSRLFGIPIEDVLEVNKNLNVTPMPLTPDYIDGVINLRGQIVPAVNLNRRLGMERKDKSGNLKQSIIIGSRNNSISLQVDEIGDVMEISPDSIEPPPETIKGLDSKYVKNVCKLKYELLVVLDCVKLQNE